MSIEHPFDNEYELRPERDSTWVEKSRLKSGARAEIDFDRSFCDAEQAMAYTGVDAPIIAGIRAGNQAFLLFDTRRSQQYKTPFLLTSEDYHHEHTRGYKGVRPDKEVVVGRHHLRDRFDTDDTMSRDHFAVRYDNDRQQLTIADLDSSNGTFVSGFVTEDTLAALETKSKGKVSADFTHSVQEELERQRRGYGDRDDEAPYGYFRNHPLIGRASTSVADGIYGTRSSEFVVVDHKSNTLRQVTGAFMASLQSRFEGNETITPDQTLHVINDYVRRTLRYDLETVDRLSEPHYYVQGMIELSQYVEAGVGVCRHQALLSALLAEKAIQAGYLNGSVGVERNHDRELNGAHAWAVVHSGSDRQKDMIIDPAQNYVGTRGQAAKNSALWRYYLPENDAI